MTGQVCLCSCATQHVSVNREQLRNTNFNEYLAFYFKSFYFFMVDMCFFFPEYVDNLTMFTKVGCEVCDLWSCWSSIHEGVC